MTLLRRGQKKSAVEAARRNPGPGGGGVAPLLQTEALHRLDKLESHFKVSSFVPVHTARAADGVFTRAAGIRRTWPPEEKERTSSGVPNSQCNCSKVGRALDAFL